MKYTMEMGSGVHYIHIKFDKDWFRHSKVNRGEFTNTNTQTELKLHKPAFTFS
jgi:hypothetical protein